MADTITKETFTVHLTYEMSVNIDTGEILETRLISRDVDKSDLKPKKLTKKVQDTDTTPKLMLEENKYRLNNAAVELMNLNDSSKLVIKYEEGKSGSIPVIGTNEAFGIASGNRLTKSNTVACRGSNHEELEKHGVEFVLVKHPNKPNMFMLVSDKDQSESLIGDENVNMSENEHVPLEVSLDSLVDEEDLNITEVDSNFFQL